MIEYVGASVEMHLSSLRHSHVMSWHLRYGRGEV